MEGPLSSDRLDALLAHRDWVRRVARALVHDESRADDLEQEAWLRALRDPPPRPSRAWLGTVLRNAARNLRRGEGRRADHEAATPPSRTVPSPEEFARRAEVVEAVARAVRNLDEPYRTAVFLRYFEDFSPPAIAEHLGVPLETVRTRLKRALALLRDRLDLANEGERKKWVLLLLPMAREPGPGIAAGTLGGIAMALKAKSAVAAALVLILLGGGLWWSHAGSTPADPVTTPTLTTGAGKTPALAVVPTPSIPEVPPIPSGPRPVLVVDPDGRPVAGAAVESLRLQPTGVDAVRPVPKPLGRTDAEGRIPWPEWEIAFPCVLHASAGEFAPGEAVALSREGEVVLRLRRGETLAGMVEAADGTPVGGATVTATVVPLGHVLGNQLGVTGTWTRTARSGVDGGFRVTGLPPIASGLVVARADGFAEATVAVRLTDSGDLRIVLGRPFRSVVRVRDRVGKPIEGASVWVFQGTRLAMGRWMQPEPAVLPLSPAGPGEYARDDLPAGWYRVLVAARGYGLVVNEEAAFGRDLPPVEAVLEETTGLRGRVVWYETKEPVAGVRIRATPLRKIPPTADQEKAMEYVRPVMEMDGPFFTTTGADGTYELPVFGPSDKFQVVAWGEDGSRGFSGHPPYPKTESLELADVWLHRLMEVDYTGRVVSDTGDPIPGAIVEGNSDVTTAGPDGRFRLVSRQAGTSLQFLAPGFLPQTRFAPGSTPKGGGDGRQDFGDVPLARLREIHGTAVDPTGRPVSGMLLWAQPVDKVELQALFKEYSFTGGSGLTDAAGAVAIAVVPGHRYSVHSFAGTGRGADDVAGDAVEPFRLVVDPEPTAGKGTIRGKLRLEDGSWKPVRVTVGLRPEGGGSSGGLAGPVDPEGAFEIPSVPSGRWGLRVSGSEEIQGELAGVAVPVGDVAEVEIPCRRTAKETDVPVEVAVRLEPAPDKPDAVKAWATRQPAGLSEPLAADAEGNWKARVRSGATCVVWACDAKGMRAGTLAIPAPGGAEPATVTMGAAGILLPPGWEYGMPEPWVEVRDGTGAVLYSGGTSGLPVVPDHGYALVLPPGTYRIEISIGEERKSPKTFTATAVAGASKKVE